MLSCFRLAIFCALIAAVFCDLDNQYFVWGKFGELFSPKGVAKASDLEKKVTELEKKLDSTIKKQERILNATCPVYYNGKCFRAIVHASAQTDRNEAIAMCKNLGWTLGNVYSREHFNMLEKYIRGISRTNPNVWLMMTWNYRTKQITMPDGSPPPKDVPWYSGNPSSSSSYTNIYLQINQNVNLHYNGILNRNYNSNLNGALCEIKI